MFQSVITLSLLLSMQCMQWDEYFDQVKPVLAHLPYMVNPGNHESDSKNSE